MTGQIAEGWLAGTGAAINVSLGWYPTKVEVFNATDGDLLTIAYLSSYHVPFSGGGTKEIKAGEEITGATSGAKARVKKVILSSGTWAAGTAAGFLILDDVVGTFAGENVYVSSDNTAGIDDATITANVTSAAAIALAVALPANNDASILRYAGSTAASRGFTIGLTVSEAAKLLRWVAYRADQEA